MGAAMSFTVGTKVSSQINLTRFDADGKVNGEWHTHNLITNLGMDNFNLAASVWDDWVILGGGSADPDITNPNISAFLAAKGYSNVDNFTPLEEENWRMRRRLRYVFLPGDLNNVNITELGLSSENTGSNLNTHAKILDDQGQPTTITVLVTESLLVEYWIYTEIDTTVRSGSITVNNQGSNEVHSWTNRLYDVDTVSTSNQNDPRVRGFAGGPVQIFRRAVSGLFVSLGPGFCNMDSLPATPDSPTADNGQTATTDRAVATTFERDTYVPGSFEQTGNAVWDSSYAFDGYPVMWCPFGWFAIVWLFDPIIHKAVGVNLRLEYKVRWWRDGIDNI